MAENNESKYGTLYECPECENVCNAVEKNTCQRNKMRQVAALFGKKLGERFSVKVDNQIYDCSFEEYGFNSYGAYENPYLSFDAFILQELLTGTAVIDDD